MKKLNSLFKESSSNIVNSVIQSGGVVLGEKFEGRRGFFTSDFDNSKNIAEKVERKTGLKGFISTEELPKYGITEEEGERVKEEFCCGENDVVILVAGAEDKASEALDIIRENVY